MNHLGSADLLVQARSALLDALEALAVHRDAVIVIGAQAIYLHTGRAQVALAEATKDSDFALDPRLLLDEPLIEDAMARAGFYANPHSQPGAWMNPAGIPVDLMVPEGLAGPGGQAPAEPGYHPMGSAPPAGRGAWRQPSLTTRPWTSGHSMRAITATTVPSLPGLRHCWSPRPTRFQNARSIRVGSLTRTLTTSTASLSLATPGESHNVADVVDRPFEQGGHPSGDRSAPSPLRRWARGAGFDDGRARRGRDRRSCQRVALRVDPGLGSPERDEKAVGSIGTYIERWFATPGAVGCIGWSALGTWCYRDATWGNGSSGLPSSMPL